MNLIFFFKNGWLCLMFTADGERFHLKRPKVSHRKSPNLIFILFLFILFHLFPLSFPTPNHFTLNE